MDKSDLIRKLDDEELAEVGGGLSRGLFSKPYCMACGKRMSRGPSLFVFVCDNKSCSRFSVVTPTKECFWK